MNYETHCIPINVFKSCLNMFEISSSFKISEEIPNSNNIHNSWHKYICSQLIKDGSYESYDVLTKIGKFLNYKLFFIHFKTLFIFWL